MNIILANGVMLMVYVTGFFAAIAALLYALWLLVVTILRMLGLWRLFYKTLMFIRREERRKK